MQSLEFINARFDSALARRARVEAARRNISRSELVRQAVAEFLRLLDEAESRQGVKNVELIK